MDFIKKEFELLQNSQKNEIDVENELKTIISQLDKEEANIVLNYLNKIQYEKKLKKIVVYNIINQTY